MEERKKRANKRQQELLVERLHNNLEMTRGNQADAAVIELWASLTNELNILGCNRTVQQWQHIWHLWVAKVKTKARKIRDSMRATGGGPSGQQLTDTENKILNIIGTASINGFMDLEAGVPPLSNSPPPSPPTSVMLPADASPLEQEQPMLVRQGVVARARRRLPRPYHRPNDNLVRALQEGNRGLQDTIRSSAEVVAAALLRAAEILAAALTSAHNSTHNVNQ